MSRTKDAVQVVAAVFLAANPETAMSDTTSTPGMQTTAAFDAELAQHGWVYGWTHGVDKVFR